MASEPVVTRRGRLYAGHLGAGLGAAGRWLAALGLPLAAAGLFLYGAGWLPGGERVLEGRRERVEAMTAAQKEELLRRQHQFQTLSPAKKLRVRALYERLQQADDGPRLRDIMRRYSQWLGSLAPYHRAELQELAPDRRVQQIKRLQAEQAKQAKTSAHSHTAKDRQGIVAWLERYAREHEAGLLEMMPEARRRQLAKAAAVGRRRAVLLFLLERWQSGNAVVHPPMSDKQLLELRSVLSPETQRRLQAKPPAEQARTIVADFRQAARVEFSTRRSENFSLPAYDEQLADFFEYQLSDEKRDWLMSLPGEEMLQHLRELYLNTLKVRESPGPRAERGAHAKKSSDKKGTEKKAAEKKAAEKKGAEKMAAEKSN